MKLTISSAAVAVIAVGFLFLMVPTETGLSFAASDGGSNNNGDSGSGQQQKTSDQPSDKPDQPTTTTPPTTGPEGDGKDKEGMKVCNEFHGCGWKPDNGTKTKIIVVHHHTTTTKTVHDGSRSLTVTQQNCMYGALQLGFSSNAQNRADATYAAILGCLGSQ